ncbi:hypothetical protein F5Y16DRAFT_69787 [Xylariaceae sp. FL0255]|nr:hypothetical protein F5Y16DRAFT_69787 [Xylariaceae sp. FL0255]
MYKEKDNMESHWPQRALYGALCLLFVAEVVAASSALHDVPIEPSLVNNTFLNTFYGFVFGLVGVVWFAILLGTTFYRLDYKQQYLRKIVAPLAAAIINSQFLIWGMVLLAIYGDTLLRGAIYAHANESAYWNSITADLLGRQGATFALEIISVLIDGFLIGAISFDFFTALMGISKISGFGTPDGSMV